MRRTLVAFAATSALVGALAGCTGSTPDDSPSASAEPTAMVTSSAEPTGTASSPVPSPSPTEDIAVDTPVVVDPPASGEPAVGVPVTVTRWGVDGDVVTAGAVIDGIVEDDGTCTLTMTRGDRVVTATGPGTPSASSTNCGADLSIPVSELGSATWSLAIAYASARFEGESTPKELPIP